MSADRTPDLHGKTALVTGASRGIGFETALHLARRGAHVISLARTVGGLEELDDKIREFGSSSTIIPADICDSEAMENLAPLIAQRFESLDILVLNAATLGELAPIPDIAEKVWNETFATNVHAQWRLLSKLDPLLRQSSGRVIALTSRVGGEEARAFWGAYGASKAAFEILVKTYAEETHAAGVRVAIVDPGAMQTRMRAAAMPGEAPAGLPHPREITPLIDYATSEDYDGHAERLVFRDWQARGMV